MSSRQSLELFLILEDLDCASPPCGFLSLGHSWCPDYVAHDVFLVFRRPWGKDLVCMSVFSARHCTLLGWSQIHLLCQPQVLARGRYSIIGLVCFEGDFTLPWRGVWLRPVFGVHEDGCASSRGAGWSDLMAPVCPIEPDGRAPFPCPGTVSCPHSHVFIREEDACWTRRQEQKGFYLIRRLFTDQNYSSCSPLRWKLAFLFLFFCLQ